MIFDRDIITHQSNFEHLLDYCFERLQMSQPKMHPVFMTEKFCIPNRSRELVNELIFEAYDIPAVCYVPDSLASYYYH